MTRRGRTSYPSPTTPTFSETRWRAVAGGRTGDSDTSDDVGFGLRRLCTAAVAELGMDGTTVTLMTAAGSVGLVAVSDGYLGRIEEMEFDAGDGPAREAFRAGRPVLVPDLRDTLGRWPGLAAAAVAAGLLSVSVFPLQLGMVGFGVLTFTSAGVRTLNSQEVSGCLVYAEVATELLLNSTVTGDDGDPNPRTAVQLRDEIYQAQGMLAVDLRVPLVEALAQMRSSASADGLTLHELASEVVTGRRRLTPRDASTGA